MILETLKIHNFRNYSHVELLLDKNINIIYGNNAQGKSNLLEAIYVLGLTKSHRSSIDSNLIKIDQKQFKISGDIKTENFSIKNRLEIICSNDKKELLINNNKIKKITDYVSNLNLIIFYPEDLNIIKGGPIDRRKFLNIELGQLSENYLNILNEYNKILKTRNELLKKHKFENQYDEKYFMIVTNYLIEKGILIYKMRKKFLEKINENAGDIYLSITNMKNFQVFYNSSYNSTDSKEILKQYQKIYEKEKFLGKTLYGPHRDDIEFLLNSKNLRSFGSQGQQRIAILSLKLAEINLFKVYKNTKPILLLDDVFSELDENKKNKLLFYISQGIQTVITTTDLKNIDDELLKKSQLIRISSGKIEEVINYGK